MGCAKCTPSGTATVFEEARKIVGALLQHITYTEYLPEIIGANAMNTYGLNEGNYVYNSSQDPSLANVFSAAAFRFGHSSIPDNLLINGQARPIQNLFKRPASVLNNMQSVVEGLLTEPAQDVDIWYSGGMTDLMFLEDGKSFDIVSLNVQRARDHKIPGYNTWRRFCGLTTMDFNSMGPDGRFFDQVYDSPEDIDLYSGALNERPVQAGADVGPLYACLIGKQFNAVKYGDRFFYENSGPSGFTAAQLTEIKKMSLSGVLCDAFDDALTIQPQALRFNTANGNAAVSCNQIPRMDLSVW